MHTLIFFRIKETNHNKACQRVDDYLNKDENQLESTFEELGGDKNHLKLLKENPPYQGGDFDDYVKSFIEGNRCSDVCEELDKLKYQKTSYALFTYSIRFDEDELEQSEQFSYNVLGSIDQKEVFESFSKSYRWDFTNFSTEKINEIFIKETGNESFNCWKDSFNDEDCIYGDGNGLVGNDVLVGGSNDNSSEQYLVIVDVMC